MIQTKKAPLHLAACALILLGASAFMLPKDSGLMRISNSNPAAGYLLSVKQTDAEFLVSASEINLAEIRLCQLAQKSSVTTDVRELGLMLELAHTKSQNDLTALAKRKNLIIPTSTTMKDQDAYKKLSEKSGKEFDQEFCEMLISDHKAALDLFEKESKDASDEEIRTWATSTLSELQSHLEHAQTCKKSCEKMK